VWSIEIRRKPGIILPETTCDLSKEREVENGKYKRRSKILGIQEGRGGVRVQNSKCKRKGQFLLKLSLNLKTGVIRSRR